MSGLNPGVTGVSESTTVEKKLIVSDVVSALTGTVSPTEEQVDLRDQMERAAAEFDKRTADAFGRALLDSLTEDPGNLRQLEALLILGLAHPDVLKKNRISLAVEGRRLGILLERNGEVDRARSVLELLSVRLPDERTIDHELAGLLRRSGNTDELVARYLKRAEAFIENGRVKEAIPWLQEILLLDRSRRDVARMIRDLRYEEAEKQVLVGRRNRWLVSLTLCATLATAVIYREITVRREFQALPEAVLSDRGLVTARLGAINEFIEEKRLWGGILGAKEEAARLEDRLDEMDHIESQRIKAAAAEQQRALELLENTRAEGLRLAERLEFQKALSAFERCLELKVPGWEHESRVRADVEALRNLLKGDQ